MNTPPASESSRPPAQRWVVVALLLTAATASGFLLERYVSLTSQAMIYVLAVVIASYKLDWIASAVCAVAAVTALNFFFVPPRWTFAVENPEHFIALGAMLVVALVISHLAKGVRRETELARLNERRARQLQVLATNLSNVSSPAEIVALGQKALNVAFAGPCCVALTHDGHELDLAGDLDPAVRDGMRCCMTEAAVLGPGTGRWPGLLAWYLPLGERGHVTGAACVRPALAGDDAGREHAQALCALLAQALWRLRLTSAMLAAQSEAQRQQLQSTFLAAISHDLRTPLAAIVGAASSLQTQHDKLSAPEQDRLLGSIVSEASYLSTVTENTLQLVQLTAPAQALKRDWESMEEIVGAVLARVRQRDPERRIKSKVPEHLPLVKADPVMLAQLISNLLDNALQYSDGAIDLTVSVEAQELLVSVKDRGPGIPEADQKIIFEAYTRGDQSGQRGAGLGLALCRAIALAHGGRLTLRARAGGGSNFVFALPLDAQPPGQELSQELP
ncbi:ATP-binding protein [Rhodoferax sp.]|uniref:ATP-binding protein n=1 Tax=Rhodoferax sp. TaxID=50421 RepID=UPI00374CCF19